MEVLEKQALEVLQVWKTGLERAVPSGLAVCLGPESGLELDIRLEVVLDRVLPMVLEWLLERKAAWQAVLLLVQEIWIV